MSSFEPRAAGSIVARPDPTKHVNYNLGMVLGVDDFTQEFAYVSGRDQWMARDLLGYGTACGLRVTVERGSSSSPQVVVTPGAAVSPRGQLIRVNPTQCADLNEWLKLERNKPRLDAIAGNLTSVSLPLFVVLCYRECRTDQVPIPGEPCRSEDESMAASRVADDFSLELRFDAPDQREEDALRDFVAWLGQMEITDTPGIFATPEQFEEAIRNAAQLLTSPLASPLDYMFGSPPTSLRIRTEDACEFLRAAFRIWITELRPIWLGQGQTASGDLPKEECVLLAELTVPILRAGMEWAVNDHTDVGVDEERRPFLLHLRMVQEWIECGLRERSPSDTVTPADRFGQPSDAGHSHAYSRADHTHGTPNMLGDVTVDGLNNTTVEALRGVPLDPSVASPLQQDAVLLFESGMWKAAPAPPVPLGGDVTGTSNGNMLTGIQGARLNISMIVGGLQDGQVLTFVSGSGGLTESVEGSGEASIDSPISEESVTSPTDTKSISQTAGQREDTEIVLPVRRPGGFWQPSHLKIQGVPVSHAKSIKPLNNQVLTYVEEGSPVEGIWKAMDLPTSGGGTPSGPSNLAGDVTGASDRNTVARIRGIEVVDPAITPPQENHVMSFNAGRWTPRNLQPEIVFVEREFGLESSQGISNRYSREDHTHGTPLLGGDVTGTSGDLTVKKIQGVPVAGPDEARYTEGAVLTFSERGGWRPEAASAASGASVQHPDVGPYSIVAAGIVKGDESVRGGFGYNALRADATAAGRLTIFFNGYENPKSASSEKPFFYIVKALPVNIQASKEQQIEPPMMTCIFFDFYQEGSLVLKVTEKGELIPKETLGQMEFMIEISRYEIEVGAA